MTDGEFVYGGEELRLFQNATNWKRYWASKIRPYLGRNVLEVGAGMGSNTPYLDRGDGEWTCLEPDMAMAGALARMRGAGGRAGMRVIPGVLADTPRRPSYDSIVYIDVLEHIEDDSAEFAEIAERLWPGGVLVVLSPAHGWLFSAFDAAIGHHRRYTAASIRALSHPDLALIDIKFLDSVGILASLFGKLTKSGDSPMPSQKQIMVWDRFIVPASRAFDWLLGYKIGKSVLAVWRKRG